MSEFESTREIAKRLVAEYKKRHPDHFVNAMEEGLKRVLAQAPLPLTSNDRKFLERMRIRP